MLGAEEKPTEGFSALIFSNRSRFFTKNECGQYSSNAQVMVRSSGLSLFSRAASLGGQHDTAAKSMPSRLIFEVFVEYLFGAGAPFAIQHCSNEPCATV